LLVPPVGRSIISDIDDTVRVTGVESKSRMLRTTLLEPFEAVCGMATVFRNWVAEGATLHFVSSTPWHFNGPLLEFFAAAGFPPATLALKKIRLKDRSIRNILADASRTKPPKLEALLSAYPERTFVLVGDSGEKDPEIYADLLRRHPSRIERVLIRNLAGAGLDSERFQAVFEGIDPGRWQLFVDAAELPASLRA
jgi:phosphatidate phosphatase APP1